MPATSPRPAPAVVILTALWCGVVACDGYSEPEPAPDHALLTEVEEARYDEWARPKGFDEPKASNGPHGAAVLVYINPAVAEAIANEDGLGRTAWPEDATIVLTGDPNVTGGTAAQIAIMQKRHGTWYWEQYQGDDRERPRFAGRPDICLGCHSGGQDFVRSFGLPEPVEEE